MITYREEVVFYDTDCGGVVSNIAYLRYIEKARCALFAERGMPLAEMNDSQIFPTVVRTEADYLKPAQLGRVVEVTARLTAIQKVRIHCEFEIRDSEQNETVFVRGKQVVVLLQMPAGRPTRPPSDWLAEIE